MPGLLRRRVHVVGATLGATLGAVVAAVLTVPVAGAVETAAPARWADVALAPHDYGRLTAPSSLVGTAGVGLFGFTPGHQGAADGPHTVAIGPDGAVWTVGSTGFVVWRPGAATAPRSVAKPAGSVLDLAIAADGTVWSTVVVQGPQRLVAQSPTGSVLVQVPYGPAETAVNASLRFGSDRVLYLETDPGRWIPLTTAAGAPLAVADQLRSAVTGIPVAPGERLAWTTPSAHEVRYTLLAADGTAVGGWRLTSATDEITPYRSTATLVGGDLVATLSTTRTTAGKQVGHELVTLRVTPAGRVTAQVTSSASAVWGDWEGAPQPGPDGALYELRTSPTSGVQVWRYALTAGTSPTGSTSTGTTSTGSTSGAATSPTAGSGSTATGTTGDTAAGIVPSPTPSAAPPATSTPAAETGWTGPRLAILGVGVLAAAVLTGAGARRLALERRRRHP